MWYRTRPFWYRNGLVPNASGTERDLTQIYSLNPSTVSTMTSHKAAITIAIRLRFSFDSTTTKIEHIHFFVASIGVVARRQWSEHIMTQ